MTSHVVINAGGLQYAVQYTPPASGTVVDAVVVRNESGSGTCQISSGFPVPEGLVSEQLVRDGKIVVTVNGSEVAANVTALRGRHNDGTVRSVLIQFSYSMAQNDAITATVTFDRGVRASSDPSYVLPTYAMVANNNCIIPTDATYLCSTGVSLRKLVPVGEGTAAEELYFSDLMDDVFDTLVGNRNYGTAAYEQYAGMIASWCRTGDRKYHKHALTDILTGGDAPNTMWLPYSTPDASSYPLMAAVANPDSRSTTFGTAVVAEQYSPRALSFAVAYLLTGYRDFWGIVCMTQQAGLYLWTGSFNTANVIRADNYDQPRFNYGAWMNGYYSIIPALMVDATKPVPISGLGANDTKNWENIVEWCIDGIEDSSWDLKWVPFGSGSGTVPANGTTLTQGGVSGSIQGVYAVRYEPRSTPGGAMPASGFIQVKSITGGSFSAGALAIAGASATATGAQETDYRQGVVGCRSNTVREGTPVALFQLTFPINFLIDMYLYIKRDSRIPPMVKGCIDAMLMNVREATPSDPRYNWTNVTYGTPTWVSPYNFENPVDTDPTYPYDCAEFIRGIMFVYKTNGNATVNGADYPTWYSRLCNAGQIHQNVLTWGWKNFGQYYGWSQDVIWMNQQSDLTTEGYASMRVPTQWNAIPSSTPDVART